MTNYKKYCTFVVLQSVWTQRNLFLASHLAQMADGDCEFVQIMRGANWFCLKASGEEALASLCSEVCEELYRLENGHDHNYSDLLRQLSEF